LIYIGMDDTDTLHSRGTGHLARVVAADLASDLCIAGVTRHQLLEDARVPCTAKNSCAAILVDDEVDLDSLFARVKTMMLSSFIPGSDPGLCICKDVPPAVVAYGERVKQTLVTQMEARELARLHDVHLEGLGGDEDGVIGALAAVGLAASGDDGRYVQIGAIRDLTGMAVVADVLEAGVARVETLDGQRIETGLVLADKLRPARRGGEPVIIVEPMADGWRPLKLN